MGKQQFVNLHSQLQGFFADASLNFSSSNYMCLTFCHVTLLLSFMKMVDYLVTLKDFFFDNSCSIGYKWPFTLKSKRSQIVYRNWMLPEARYFMICFDRTFCFWEQILVWKLLVLIMKDFDNSWLQYGILMLKGRRQN